MEAAHLGAEIVHVVAMTAVGVALHDCGTSSDYGGGERDDESEELHDGGR